MRAVLLAIIFSLAFQDNLRGEFPALEKKLASKIATLARTIGDGTVLVSMTESSPTAASWNLTAAIETEIVAQLLALGIDASDDDTDERFFGLGETKNKAAAIWRKQPAHDFLLTAKFKGNQRSPTLVLELYDQDNRQPVSVASVKFRPDDITLDANLPALNRKIVEFVEKFDGTTLGDGRHATAAVLALNDAGGRRPGKHVFGRKLGPNEAVLPGDILSFNQVVISIKGQRTGMSFDEHTAIVGEIVGPGVWTLFHQGNRYARRELRRINLNVNNLQSGSITAFRPVNNDTIPLPLTFDPIRKSVPDVDWSNHKIDLLELVDPNLDTISGVWGKWKGPLRVNRQRQAKIQIPIDVPDRYVLRITAKRERGVNGLSIIPVIAGRQVMLTIDGFGGKVTGLGLINGKMENDNATTNQTTLFPTNRDVVLALRVLENRITLKVDNKIVLDWTGDPKELTLLELHEVPNKHWIHLGAYESNIVISAMSIETIE